MTYQEALETGKVVLRRAWKNTNSSKDQITGQFAQQIEKPTEGTSSRLVAIAQGMDNMNQNVVTALWSFDRKTAKQLGLTLGDFHDMDEGEDEGILAEDIFGEEVSIQVVENTTKNPLSPRQTPKINPSSGEVLLFGEKPIFRHTTLVEGSSPRIDLKQHDGVCSYEEYEEWLESQGMVTGEPA